MYTVLVDSFGLKFTSYMDFTHGWVKSNMVPIKIKLEMSMTIHHHPRGGGGGGGGGGTQIIFYGGVPNETLKWGS